MIFTPIYPSQLYNINASYQLFCILNYVGVIATLIQNLMKSAATRVKWNPIYNNHYN